jgi:transcriptional regulator with XRE-family HTH domain
VNERLRTVMLRRGVESEELAKACDVDPKTVERWVSVGRVPHRRHRWATARRLGVDEAYLWPQVVARRQLKANDELVAIYPDRASVPRETLIRLLDEARERIDVLVFSGTFFAQVQPRVAAMLSARVQAGAKVRLCFGDPSCEAVAIRDREERLGGRLAAKIRASLTYYRGLLDVAGCEVRLHDVTVYASIFRYDDQLLANPHVYGEPASLNPTFHFQRLDGGSLFDHYAGSFERVWAQARPWNGAEV